MLKRRNRLLGAAAAVVTAAAIAVPGAAAATAASQPSVSGTESFQIMNTSATSTTASFITQGAFTAGGTDHQGGKTDTIALPDGSFKITHSKGTGPQSFNPKTCLLTVNQHGTYTVSGGTGNYTGISGSGTYKISILAIAARSGGACSKTLPPTTFQLVIRGSGPVTL